MRSNRAAVEQAIDDVLHGLADDLEAGGTVQVHRGTCARRREQPCDCGGYSLLVPPGDVACLWVWLERLDEHAASRLR